LLFPTIWLQGNLFFKALCFRLLVLLALCSHRFDALLAMFASAASLFYLHHLRSCAASATGHSTTGGKGGPAVADCIDASILAQALSFFLWFYGTMALIAVCAAVHTQLWNGLVGRVGAYLFVHRDVSLDSTQSCLCAVFLLATIFEAQHVADINAKG